MRYCVTIAGETYQVELNGEQVFINGELVDAELQQVADTLIRRLRIGGRTYRLAAQRGDDKELWRMQLDGERILAEVVDERTQAIRALTARTTTTQGPKPIRAPMPGMIVRVEVTPGVQVHAGQGVIIIEAMKMENELKADAAGVVARVLAREGTAVEKGAVLVEFAHE